MDKEFYKDNKQLIIKGAVKGLTTGLLVTFVDSLYMLIPETYVPKSYPFLLTIFNMTFWTAFGCLSGLLLWIFLHNKKAYHDHQNYYWTIFFLVPFTLIYGLLGKLSLYKFINPAFDHHLSFFWVALVVLFLIVNKKRIATPKSFSISFIPEILTVIVLFNFCSNIENLPFVSNYFSYLFSLNFMKDHEKFLIIYKRFCIWVYAIGVLLIIGLYVVIFRNIKMLNIIRSKTCSIIILEIMDVE